MVLTHDFQVPESPTAVFEALTDLDLVAPCLPGSWLGAQNGDGVRDAGIEVKVGPMRFRYEGTVRIVEEDAATRRAVLVAEGRETSGEGSAEATIAMHVAEGFAGAHVEIETHLQIAGGIAQIGRGMVEEIGQELIDDFAVRLRLRLNGAEHPADAVPAPDAAPVRVERLVLRVLARRLRRVLRIGR